jgi:ferric-dicitrate binding protein FerR (iron transport regulator)
VVVNSGKVRQDVLPGKQGAILTLADGSHIVLDSLGNGVVTTQGNQRIILSNGRILYKGINGVTPEKALYNTMSTPKGRQYQLVLPDGSKVWLNAASSITYPIAFTGNERVVTVTGEAYFEVTHLSRALSPGVGAGKVPFIVKINTPSGNGEEVDVLGTHFNINAYDDESAIKTTLLEGSVRMTKGSNSLLIRPGQQAVFLNHSSGEKGIVSEVDVDQVMAWKEGLFNFEGADLKTVLRQLGRWYDVEIVFEGNIPQRKFGGEIPMNLNLSQVLQLLEKIEVKYRIEGKKLVVTP